MTLWTATEAAAATSGTTTADWTASGVSIDTRSLQPGDLFVALTAARDGHDFVAQALAAGAAAALVSRRPDGVAANAPLLIVPDVLAGLEALGRAARARTSARVVAVTGSVGKTSTKEMLARIFADQGRTHASVASYNNHWGVPLTLARMPADTEFAVIEIGINHPGEIAPLARQARPDAAMITTVAPAHLEAFDSVAAIAREKAAIFEGLQPGGVAVLNADIDEAQILQEAALARGAALRPFGRSAEAWHLSALTLQGDTTIVQTRIDGAAVPLRIRSAGAHFAMNGLGALALATAVGADLGRAVMSLGQWSPYKGRGAREILTLDAVDTQARIELIDDSYNANPASMAAALAVLGAARPASVQGRRIAFLGDMKELGPQGPALHAALARTPGMEQIDCVHCIGPLMHHLYAALPETRRGLCTETSAALLAGGLAGLIRPGDILLAKGSLSMKLGQIVDAIRKMGHGAPQTED